MSDLRKLVDDLASLTAIETEALAALLDEQPGVRTAPAVERLRRLSHHDRAPEIADGSVHDLAEEDWLAAEFLSLGREAKDVARSLDETLTYVRARCDAVRGAA